MQNNWAQNLWLPSLATAVIVLAAIFAAGHAVLNKRDPRAGFGWLAVCLLFPFFGTLLYFFFGINRIQSRARKLQQRARLRLDSVRASRLVEAQRPLAEKIEEVEEEEVRQALETLPARDAELGRIGAAVGRWPLAAGNEIEMLHNGEELYPRMLEAIAGARSYIYLATYIFDTDETGHEFIDALGAASERGVDVRVLVDGVGQMYNIPWASTLLRLKGVTVHRFIPPRLIPPAIHINLRNHRKILVVDGEIGFTGGMNISQRHVKKDGKGVIDLHSRLLGPIVCQLEQAFLEDWAFVTEHPEEPRTLPENRGSGASYCRVITDGPDEDLEKLLVILTSVISAANDRVWIMTPYFLPPRTLIGALQAAALRGVEVKILLPEKSDAPVVDWASRGMLWEVLERGVRIFYRSGLFAHSKLLVIDDSYVQIGSANLDPRSLRLNFELAVEIFDPKLVEQVCCHCEDVAGECRELELEELKGRSLPIRLRDSLAGLFSPYL